MKTQDPIEREVLRAVRAMLPTMKSNRVVKFTDTLTALGMDSLDLVEIVIDLELEFDILLSDEDVYSVKTVQDLVDRVRVHRERAEK